MIRDRAWLIELGEAKDPSGLYLAKGDEFLPCWSAAVADAKPWTEYAKADAEAHRQELWSQCQALALDPQILSRFAETLQAQGVVGEARTAKLLYLSLTSRLLGHPVSCAVKGPSSAGKSYIMQRVLEFFPSSAYYALTAMSERALAYSNEPLAHRMLVLYEAAGIRGDVANYLVRSLLSEARLRYETVEKTKQGLRARLIEKDGPTGLLVTTTAVRLHEENETRLLSMPVTDTPEQTKAVLRQIAQHRQQPPVDLTPWHALQELLAGEEYRVRIPYAEALAELIPPVAITLRRTFGTVLALIEAHAILHQARRWRDHAGRLVATLDDYAVVRDLVKDLVAEGVEMTVPDRVRQTVEAVRQLHEDTDGEVTIKAVARQLRLDKVTAGRRVHEALEAGYLKNLETQKGRPYRLIPGEHLPEELELLPLAATETLEAAWLGALEEQYIALLKQKAGT